MTPDAKRALDFERLVDLCGHPLWFDADPRHIAEWAEKQGIPASLDAVLAAREHPRAQERIAEERRLDEDFCRRWDAEHAAK